MIGYLTGKIFSKKPTRAVIDVQGVGYVVNISINTFDKLGEEGSPVSLYTHLQVRENAMDLFGFFSLHEKEMFELLITINGIGPKLAQSILSGIQVNELKEAIKTANLSRIIAAPGIGRKTGERLIVELRDKIESIGEMDSTAPDSKFSVKGDAVAALSSLGYNPKVAEKAILQLLSVKPDLQIEELVKNALSLLNK